MATIPRSGSATPAIPAARGSDPGEIAVLYDGRTGLHSRAWILDMIDVSLQACGRHGLSVGLIVMDFALPPTSSAISVDDLAAALAPRVAGVLRAGTHIGLSRRDQFLVLVPGVSGPHRVRPVAQRMLAAAVRVPIPRLGVPPLAHLGVAMSRVGSVAPQLYDAASQAAAAARAKGPAAWQFHSQPEPAP